MNIISITYDNKDRPSQRIRYTNDMLVDSRPSDKAQQVYIVNMMKDKDSTVRCDMTARAVARASESNTMIPSASTHVFKCKH
jgi:hypothetical protein